MVNRKQMTLLCNGLFTKPHPLQLLLLRLSSFVLCQFETKDLHFQTEVDQSRRRFFLLNLEL